MATRTFEIYFFGLICFVHNDESGNIDRAELVLEDGHDRELFVAGWPQPIPITGSVRFTGLPLGAVQPDRCFDEDVTHLSDHVSGGGAAHTGAHTKPVLMPAGKLLVADYYPCSGYFHAGEAFAIPRLTALVTQTSATVDVLIDDTSVAKLTKEPWILIANRGEKHAECGPGKSHFEMFRRITTATHIDSLCQNRTAANIPNCNLPNTDNIDAIRTLLNLTTECAFRVVDQVDCSSSQWP